jgi:gas vesicle protein
MKLMRYLFVGSVGAAIGMLLAPKPGKDLRRELDERFGSRLSGAGLLSSGESSGAVDTETGDSLQAKIEATRQRLQEQAEGQSQP